MTNQFDIRGLLIHHILISNSSLKEKANVLFRTFSNDAASIGEDSTIIMLETVAAMAIEYIPYLVLKQNLPEHGEITTYLDDLRPGISKMVQDSVQLLLGGED